MPRFSIVIPIYNSYNLLGKCLENLENQTFKDFEIVAIDDCSTDNSFIELQNYSKNSKLNFHIFKNDKNSGPGATRNNGIRNATGEYILFIDSDDYIETNSLELINKVIEENKVDCVIFDFVQIMKHNKIKRKSINKKESQYIDTNDALIYCNASTCGKVYLLDIIKNNKIEFPDLMRNEDFVFNKLALAKCNKIYYLNESLYNYIDNPDSLMNNKKLIDEKNNIVAFEIVEKELKGKYDKALESIFIIEYLYSITIKMIDLKYDSKKIKDHIKFCKDKYPYIYKNEIINNSNAFKKTFIKATKLNSVFILKILLKLKKVIRKFL